MVRPMPAAGQNFRDLIEGLTLSVQTSNANIQNLVLRVGRTARDRDILQYPVQRPSSYHVSSLCLVSFAACWQATIPQTYSSSWRTLRAEGPLLTPSTGPRFALCRISKPPRHPPKHV